MKLFVTCLVFAMAAIHFAFAGTGRPPKIIFPKSFTASLKKDKSLFEGSSAKICACQVLQVVSTNEQETFIAVFAQGSNDGNSFFNFMPVNHVLEKEKKHLKEFFFTKITTAENIKVPAECNMLYKNIQAKYENIKLYDVLDADALNHKLVSSK